MESPTTNQYSALELASYIVKEMNARELYLDHLKLQKLLYYINVYWMDKFGVTATMENTEKWQLGPVIKEVYSEYKVNGSYPITEVPKKLVFNRESFFIRYETIEAPSLKQEEVELISEVLEVYGKKGSFELVDETHEHSPWKSHETQIIQRGIRDLIYSEDDFLMVANEIKGDN